MVQRLLSRPSAPRRGGPAVGVVLGMWRVLVWGPQAQEGPERLSEGDARGWEKDSGVGVGVTRSKGRGKGA